MSFPRFSKRAVLRESMDDPAVDQEVIRAEYRYLARLNRAGRTAEHLLEELFRRGVAGGSRSIGIIDFGAGGGDVAARLSTVASVRHVQVDVLASDRSSVAVGYAAARADGRYRTKLIDVLVSEDAVAPGSFTVAHCSLMLHHFDDEAVVRALVAMSAAASELVVWTDLIRDVPGIAGARLSTLLSRPEVRKDAVSSVRRGFTQAEARSAAEAAGLVDISVRRLSFGRFMLSGRPGPVPARRPTVRATCLEVHFGARHVLRGFSMAAHAGEAVAVRGVNGAGKSTLLACLAGALRPVAGSAWCDPTLGCPGFHPQDGGIMPDLDAATNLSLFARLAGVPSADIEEMVRGAIDRWCLAATAGRPVSRLSGGMRRRVALAASTVHRPRLLLLDEPDAGLDAAGRQTLSSEIARVTGAGGTAVISTHLMESMSVPPGSLVTVEFTE